MDLSGKSAGGNADGRALEDEAFASRDGLRSDHGLPAPLRLLRLSLGFVDILPQFFKIQTA